MNTPWGLEAEIVADASTRQVVLIVEDEALVRMTAVDMIEEAGFEILEAANADEAILLLEARRDITVLFTDIEMPGSMDGLRLAQAVRGRWPPIKIIATSGRCVVGVRRLLVPILLNGGFGYENYLQFCSPLAVDHRL
jgi:CheY-like chemotaxis protein